MSIEAKQKKGKIIEEIKEAFLKCNVGILTDYRGLKNSEITALRRKLQESSAGYKVVKNTLARFAAEQIDRSEITGSFEGPVAIVFGYDDLSQPAKVLADYIRTSKLEIPVKGGFIGDRVLTAEEVSSLASLPSKEVLVAKVLGTMQSPFYALVGTLSNPLRGMVGVLQARIKQLEEE